MNSSGVGIRASKEEKDLDQQRWESTVMRVQCDEAMRTRQQEHAQGTDKCLTAHLAPALKAARYTNFLAGPGLTGQQKECWNFTVPVWVSILLTVGMSPL